MKLATIRTFASTRIARAIASYVQFTSLSTMASSVMRLPNAIKQAHRSLPAAVMVDKFNKACSTYWAVTQYLADSHDVVIDNESMAAKAVTKKMVAIKPEEMAALAEATGLTIAEVTAKRKEVYAKAIANESAHYDALLGAIEATEYDTTIEFDDIEVDAEAAHKKAVEVATWVSTWDRPDYAELVLIKQDRTRLEALALQELASKEGAPDYPELGGQPTEHASSSQMRQALLAARKAAAAEENAFVDPIGETPIDCADAAAIDDEGDGTSLT